MGLFWNRKKHKVAPPAAEPQALQEHEQHTHPVGPTVERGQHVHPEHHSVEHAHHHDPAPVDHAHPHAGIEMRKFVFRLSSHDPEKCNVFIKEVLRKVNRHDSHHLSGRIGMHIDGKKMRMDIKGKPDDIENFMHWCKTDHLGVHMYQIIESKVHRMPYSGLPLFQVQHGHWPTS